MTPPELTNTPGATDHGRAPRVRTLRAETITSHWLVRDVVVPFLVTRLALQLVGWMAYWLLPATDAYRPSENLWLVNMWARWDSEWYLSIARDGYGTVSRLGQHDYAFAPLYPLLMRAVAMVLRHTSVEWFALAGMLISNLAALGAATYLVCLLRLDAPPGVARRASLYLLAYPASLFLSAVYAEALFLLLAIGAFYYCRTGRWWLACLLASLAGAARSLGVLVILPIAFEYWLQRRESGRLLRRDALALLLLPLGFLAWMAEEWRLSGDPLTLLGAQADWGRHLAPPWTILSTFFASNLQPHASSNSWLDRVFLVALLVLTLASWRYLRPSLALYSTLFFLPIVSTTTVSSVLRHGLVMFPSFAVLAYVGRVRIIHESYLVIAGVLGGVLMAFFAIGGWVG